VFSYEYEMPAVTVDVLITKIKAVDIGEWSVRLLLVKRRNDPFKGLWAFPGGFVNKFEEPSDACIREVREETGIVLDKRPGLFFSAGGKDRDPRGWTITLAHWIQVPWETAATPGDDAAEVGWFDELPPMAFDHRTIYEKYLSARPYILKLESL